MSTQSIDENLSATKPLKILWANLYCLFDTSSGASMSVREMLSQLTKKGHKITILGSTVFDVPNGVRRISDQWDQIKSKRGQLIAVNDDNLTHRLFVTANTNRHMMTAGEEAQWYQIYQATLDEIKPDIVFYYGGQPFDFHIAELAKEKNIPVVSYLANPNYSGKRWCRDVDMIITDTQATADFYKKKEGYDVQVVGKFINPWAVISPKHSRERVLFINPVPEKGAYLVAQLAVELEKNRPDIKFEVVESRGVHWDGIVDGVLDALKLSKRRLKNVTVTKNSEDMRPIYGRARVLLAPSLWWESGGRVVAEALLNGIPAIVSNNGGMPEVLDGGGLKIDFTPEMYQAPFNKLMPNELLDLVVKAIIELFDNQEVYNHYVQSAIGSGLKNHKIEDATLRIENVFNALLNTK